MSRHFPYSDTEVREIRKHQLQESLGLQHDENGFPPPNEKPYAHYIVIKHVRALTIEYPNQEGAIGVAPYLGKWFSPVGPIIDLSVLREKDSWTIYVGFPTVQQAWIAGLTAPSWVTPDSRWCAFIAKSRWL